jgi:hypothetical protein
MIQVSLDRCARGGGGRRAPPGATLRRPVSGPLRTRSEPGPMARTSHEPTFSGNVTHAFSSRLRLVREAQVGALGRITFGLAVIMPTSWGRSAKKLNESCGSNSRSPLRLGGADVVGFEKSTQDTLGGDRGIVDELLLPTTTPQKYHDHGLSMVVLRITRPILGPRRSAARAGTRETHRLAIGLDRGRHKYRRREALAVAGPGEDRRGSGPQMPPSARLAPALAPRHRWSAGLTWRRASRWRGSCDGAERCQISTRPPAATLYGTLCFECFSLAR